MQTIVYRKQTGVQTARDLLPAGVVSEGLPFWSIATTFWHVFVYVYNDILLYTYTNTYRNVTYRTLSCTLGLSVSSPTHIVSCRSG